ncbi:MAG TPA: hypothetical protein VEU96_11270 [Bryobacteraceae bacterium]|nr:hypothetical protein [Bryobacteraceae bacterium]
MNEPINPNGHDKNRADVNRANSKHSTGPRTPAGKLRSSLNALRHGLTGHTIVLPSEDLAAYQRHSQRWLDEFQPQGVLEEQLAQSLCDTTWRLNRIPALETNLLTLGITEHAANINTAEPEAQAALAMAAALRDHARAIATISMQEQRLTRQFHKTLEQLQQIQSQRRHREENQLKSAAEFFEMHKEKGLPYTPADDGFVFATPEIEAHIRLRDREILVKEASLQRYMASA